MATFKDSSRQAWTSTTSVEHINAGSLQRIANAAELMAGNFTHLQNDLARYKKWYLEKCESDRIANRRINSLKGVITRLKKASKRCKSATSKRSSPETESRFGRSTRSRRAVGLSAGRTRSTRTCGYAASKTRSAEFALSLRPTSI